MLINTTIRSVNLDPRDAQFVQNPYTAYHQIRAVLPAFKWEQYGHWCFATHEDVNALLRDRRFGRQILHVATREELGWVPVPEHIKVFAEHARVPLSRDKLAELARGRELETFDRSIDVQVSRVRKLLEADSTKPQYLQTVWGVGYVFIPD